MAGLKERLATLEHEIITSFSPIDIHPQEYESPGRSDAKYLKQIVAACQVLASQTENSVNQGEFPLVLGGDHSIALGTIAGVSTACKKQNKELGILYVDAHGDFNTHETSPSGNIHGMCLAASCGYGLPQLIQLYTNAKKVDPKNVCYVGLRDIDPKEKLLMKLSFTVKGSAKDVYTYEFRRIDDRRVMVSLYNPGYNNTVSDFYITTFAFKKIVTNFDKLLNGVVIDPDSAY